MLLLTSRGAPRSLLVMANSHHQQSSGGVVTDDGPVDGSDGDACVRWWANKLASSRLHGEPVACTSRFRPSSAKCEHLQPAPCDAQLVTNCAYAVHLLDRNDRAVAPLGRRLHPPRLLGHG